MPVPFFRPSITNAEVREVVDTLNSGWLTSGPRAKRFEKEFAEAVGAPHAVAVNSCTAALHLAVHALGLREGQGVLVPAFTFAATAEIIRYQGAIPILVDCEFDTLNMDLDDAERKIALLRAGALSAAIPPETPVVGIIPVHVGGVMMDIGRLRAFAERHGLWMVEDAAHAFPAAWRPDAFTPWQRCGERTSAVTCFSFYANKTITTGEGGMAVTSDPALADQIRSMALHGLSNDAWDRYNGGGSWDYRIMAPGYKYNLTDVAAAIGIHQLARAEEMRQQRQHLAHGYLSALSGVDEIDLPLEDPNRLHAWHLFPIRLRLDRLGIARNEFFDELGRAGVGCAVHWRPLHLHPYYRDAFGWRPEDLPVATHEWERVISLPLFPGMQPSDLDHVVNAVSEVCLRHRRVAISALDARPSLAQGV